MKKLFIIIIGFILVLSFTGCVSQSDHDAVINSNRKLRDELLLYQQNTSGNLVTEYQELQDLYTNLLEIRYISEVALEYLLNEGWEIVYIEGFVNVKQNDYDYIGTDVLIVHDVGFMDDTKYYKEGLDSFFMLNSGPAIAKDGIFYIDIIDSMGMVNTYYEYKQY